MCIGIAYQTVGQPHVDPAKPTSRTWTYRLPDMPQFERYLLELPQPFFQVLVSKKHLFPGFQANFMG